MTNNKQQWAVDKAKELIDKMTKQYALIAVDEIINVTAGLKGWIDGFQCWEEVKKEIENYDKVRLLKMQKNGTTTDSEEVRNDGRRKSNRT